MHSGITLTVVAGAKADSPGGPSSPVRLETATGAPLRARAKNMDPRAGPPVGRELNGVPAEPGRRDGGWPVGPTRPGSGDAADPSGGGPLIRVVRPQEGTRWTS